jgi:hypothetical protein
MSGHVLYEIGFPAEHPSPRNERETSPKGLVKTGRVAYRLRLRIEVRTEMVVR